MDPIAREASACVRTIAAELGMAVKEPILLADRSNLVLHLAPHPIVARVAMATSAARVGMAWLRREVEVSRFLVTEGVPVTRPAPSAGPFERGGFVISLWELETLSDVPVDARAAGAVLARAHRALASYPRERVPLWGGIEEAREVFARGRARGVFDASELARIDAAWERGEAIVASVPSRTASFQAVHGDAHLRNVLSTARGAVWTDWEDAFLGPVEWDIACLRSRAELLGEEVDTIEAMTAGYDAPYDVALARDLGLLRNLQVIPWLAVFAEREPELLARMRDRIERLE